MAADGLVRKIDKLGRIVLPVEFRRSLNLEVEDDVEIMLEGNFVKISKHENGCVFCGEMSNTSKYCDKLVCEECRKNLTKDL